MSLESWDYVKQSVTKTSDTNHSDIHNSGYDQLLVLINVTAVDTADADETYEFKVQGKDPISGTYYDIISTGTFTSTGLQRLEVATGITTSANAKASNIVPEHFRVKLVTGGTTPSITYTIHVELS